MAVKVREGVVLTLSILRIVASDPVIARDAPKNAHSPLHVTGVYDTVKSNDTSLRPAVSPLHTPTSDTVKVRELAGKIFGPLNVICSDSVISKDVPSALIKSLNVIASDNAKSVDSPSLTVVVQGALSTSVYDPVKSRDGVTVHPKSINVLSSDNVIVVDDVENIYVQNLNIETLDKVISREDVYGITTPLLITDIFDTVKCNDPIIISNPALGSMSIVGVSESVIGRDVGNLSLTVLNLNVIVADSVISRETISTSIAALFTTVDGVYFVIPLGDNLIYLKKVS